MLKMAGTSAFCCNRKPDFEEAGQRAFVKDTADKVSTGISGRRISVLRRIVEQIVDMFRRKGIFAGTLKHGVNTFRLRMMDERRLYQNRKLFHIFHGKGKPQE